MQPKIIFLDLDGTILSNIQTISTSFEQYVSTLQKEKNIKFIACTGRTVAEVESVLPKTLKLDGYITSNGMSVRVQNKKIFEKTIDEKTVHELVTFSMTHGLYHEVHHHGGWRTAMKVSDDAMHERINSRNYRSVEWIDTIRTDHVEKVLIFHDDIARVAQFFTALQQLHKTLHFTSALSSADLIDISAEHVTKASGAEEILKIFNLTWQDAAAFGDGGNDLPLFDRVGQSIAMKNARSDVQKRAHTVTQFTNDEDGVYKHLQTLFN